MRVLPVVFKTSIVQATAHTIATGLTTVCVYPKHYRLIMGKGVECTKRIEIVNAAE
jgi:hypothetical protein